VNNQRSSAQLQQFVIMMVLTVFAVQIFNNWFGPKKTATGARTLPPKALQAAFKGVDPAQPPLLDKTTGAAEVVKLQAAIKADESDDYSYWARLREGLIQQYALKNGTEAVKLYDEVVQHNASTDISAQATYQKGDLLWRQDMAKSGKPSPDAAKALENLIHRGRGSSAFLDLKINIPADELPAMTSTAAATAADPLAVPTGWKLETVRDLHGTATAPHPDGILERVDLYYSTTLYHKIFDAAVRALGNNPSYSYGIAILIFAICTRLLLQPLNKKQYDSMRGMAIIAPEMKKIQDRYKNKKDQESQIKMMNEIRALQKSHGVNPMLGCGLAAVQIPVFFYVVSPFIQHFEARMELVGASFLWIHNLARPDIPLLVLYAFSQFASMRLSSTPPADDQQRQMQMMMLFFPFVMPFFLLSWPSAFTMYWMTFNILSMFFQFRMMKKADPSKDLIDQLFKQPLIPKIVTAPDSPGGSVSAGAVPPRPKNASGRSTLREDAVKTLSPERPKNGAGANGSSNGASPNGTAENGNAAPQAFTSSSALNGHANGSATAARKKRKKR
jgi:YidC/Oxa1 family membrane protein insertase